MAYIKKKLAKLRLLSDKRRSQTIMPCNRIWRMNGSLFHMLLYVELSLCSFIHGVESPNSFHSYMWSVLSSITLSLKFITVMRCINEQFLAKPFVQLIIARICASLTAFSEDLRWAHFDVSTVGPEYQNH